MSPSLRRPTHSLPLSSTTLSETENISTRRFQTLLNWLTQPKGLRTFQPLPSSTITLMVDFTLSLIVHTSSSQNVCVKVLSISCIYRRIYWYSLYNVHIAVRYKLSMFSYALGKHSFKLILVLCLIIYIICAARCYRCLFKAIKIRYYVIFSALVKSETLLCLSCCAI